MSLLPDDAPALPDGLWVTVPELAARKGFSRQSVHERVAKLKTAGLITVRPGRGRSFLVNLAEYDRAVGDVADLSREQGARTKRGEDQEEEASAASPSASQTYTREQARRMSYDAELKRLDLEERQGVLIRRDLVSAGARQAGEEIARIFDGLTAHVDDLVQAAEKDGMRGVRALVKRIAYEQRCQAGKAMEVLCADPPPEPDPAPGPS